MENRSSTDRPAEEVDQPEHQGTDGVGISGTSEVNSYILSEDSEATPVLSVVMPTLNEEEGVAKCIRRVKYAVSELGVRSEIIISDSSTDRTPKIAQSMGAIVVEPDQSGYGYAYQYAFERARGDYIAIGDADTTYDFGELPKLYELVANGTADMAMGSRLNGEIKQGAMPKLHQYIGNPILTQFLNLFYDAGVSDAHSGMRVLSREAWEQMECGTNGMEFASEMIMEAGAQGLEIAEEPITYHPREGEATLDSFRDGWRHVRFMLLNAPSYLFSVPGVVLGTLGIVLMGLSWSDISVGGASFGIRSTISGGLLTMVGYQIGQFGIFSSLTGNPVRTPNDPLTGTILDVLTLERGVLLGLTLVGVGTAYVATAISQWIAGGYLALPSLLTDIIALASIVLGIQTIFGSFFASALQEL